MSNGSRPPPMPVAWNDFFKTNGTKTAVFNEGPSMTRQEFAEECDINNIMKRYETTGFLPPMPDGAQPVYVDWAAMPQDLMQGMELMQGAERAFMQLPASVRKTFDNNAYAFVDFASDPGNLDQMRIWGLAPPAEKVTPAPVPPDGGPPPPASGAPSGAPGAAAAQVPPPPSPSPEPPRGS